MFAVMAVFSVTSVGQAFFPDTDPNQVRIGFVAPEGTNLETSNLVAQEAQRRIDAILDAGGAAPDDFRADPRVEFPETTDLPATFDEVNRRGVWWELGRRFEVPGELPLISSAEFGREAAGIFERMLPVYDLIVGEKGDAEPADPGS